MKLTKLRVPLSLRGRVRTLLTLGAAVPLAACSGANAQTGEEEEDDSQESALVSNGDCDAELRKGLANLADIRQRLSNERLRVIWAFQKEADAAFTSLPPSSVPAKAQLGSGGGLQFLLWTPSRKLREENRLDARYIVVREKHTSPDRLDVRIHREDGTLLVEGLDEAEDGLEWVCPRERRANGGGGGGGSSYCGGSGWQNWCNG